MRNFLSISFLWLCVFISNVVFASQGGAWDSTSEKDIKLALLYNQLLNEQQIDKAMSLVAKEANFSDFTWGVQDKDKAHLFKAYSMSMSQYHNLEYIVRNVFSGRGTVIIQMIASADVEKRQSKMSENNIHIVADFIRVISVKDDLILRHIDLVDYDKFMPKLMK